MFHLPCRFQCSNSSQSLYYIPPNALIDLTKRPGFLVLEETIYCLDRFILIPGSRRYLASIFSHEGTNRRDTP
jgi:hypothetical protein